MTKREERPAVVLRDSWAGRSREHVVIVDETPKRFRVRNGAGRVYLVPKRAVTFAGALLPGELIDWSKR